jgi:hypothetical protein
MMRLITKGISFQVIESGDDFKNEWRVKGTIQRLIPPCGDETVGISGAVSDLTPVVQM